MTPVTPMILGAVLGFDVFTFDVERRALRPVLRSHRLYIYIYILHIHKYYIYIYVSVGGQVVGFGTLLGCSLKKESHL